MDERARLAGHLAELVQQHSSGTLFIRTGESRAAMVLLDKGDIVEVRFGPFKGQKALGLLCQSGGLTWRFEPGPVIRPTTDLSGTAETLKAFSGGRPIALIDEQPRGITINTAVIDALAACVMPFLGPAAGAICRDIAAQFGGLETVEQFESAVRALAAEIGQTDDATRFMRSARDACAAAFASGG